MAPGQFDSGGRHLYRDCTAAGEEQREDCVIYMTSIQIPIKLSNKLKMKLCLVCAFVLDFWYLLSPEPRERHRSRERELVGGKPA